MNKYVLLIGLMMSSSLYVMAKGTDRIEQFSNSRVKVWNTVIYPAAKQALPMHRHEHDRVLIALTDGELQITSDKGDTHPLKLVKDKAYYLKKDLPGELHNDVNTTNHPIKVVVIELKDEA
ncbi:MAG: hypothetical protein Q8M40_06515 [Legionella sp.]|nr:hypothetical protein [Legionella sp.]